MSYTTLLDRRGVIAVEGSDRVRFLQGMVSNDVTAALPGTAVWTAFLTPQGRWLADFFVFADPEQERLLLDCEQGHIPDLIKRLSRFRLRADVRLTETSMSILTSWGDNPSPPAGSIHAPDPRHPLAGQRYLLASSPPEVNATPDDYDLHRLALGLPDGSRDCEAEKTLLLEANFDVLNGISWTKGCYMGQELTARTHYRGLVKRRLVPIALAEHPLPVRGTPILTEDGKEAGELRSSCNHIGLAMLRPEYVEQPLFCNEHAIETRIPDWLMTALKKEKPL